MNYLTYCKGLTIAVLEEAHTDGLPRVILKFTFTELKTLTSYWQR